jgi:hypothetical protein
MPTFAHLCVLERGLMERVEVTLKIFTTNLIAKELVNTWTTELFN